MARAKSTGSGQNVAAVVAGSTAERPKTLTPKGSRSTGAGSKRKGPSLEDTLLIAQSAITMLAQHFGQIELTNGAGDYIYMRLPASLHMCIEPRCLRLFPAPQPDSLYCDLHRPGHSTPVTVQETADGQPDPQPGHAEQAEQPAVHAEQVLADQAGPAGAGPSGRDEPGRTGLPAGSGSGEVAGSDAATD